MNRKEFFYELPAELIAQEALDKRDNSRLMVIDRRAQTIRHDIFANLTRYLPPKSTIVVNNSKVFPARLLGQRQTGGQVEIFLLKKHADGTFSTLISPLGRQKLGEKIFFKDSTLVAEIIDKENRLVRFNYRNVFPYLAKVGHVPLPPYIKRKDRPADRARYQTVYAKHAGSVAAPTAGLHFTDHLLGQLKKTGHALAKVTLHVNQGTFKPVEAADITQHKMHAEEYSLSAVTWQKIQKAHEAKRPIVAVGTTSCRVLESMAATQKLSGETNIFIYPGYRFKMTDSLITNFHLPYSTLLMLVYAFGPPELMRRAYREAIKEKYRFYSYGDAMLIL